MSTEITIADWDNNALPAGTSLNGLNFDTDGIGGGVYNAETTFSKSSELFLNCEIVTAATDAIGYGITAGTDNKQTILNFAESFSDVVRQNQNVGIKARFLSGNGYEVSHGLLIKLGYFSEECFRLKVSTIRNGYLQVDIEQCLADSGQYQVLRTVQAPSPSVFAIVATPFGIHFAIDNSDLFIFFAIQKPIALDDIVFGIFADYLTATAPVTLPSIKALKLFYLELTPQMIEPVLTLRPIVGLSEVITLQAHDTINAYPVGVLEYNYHELFLTTILNGNGERVEIYKIKIIPLNNAIGGIISDSLQIPIDNVLELEIKKSNLLRIYLLTGSFQIILIGRVEL